MDRDTFYERKIATAEKEIGDKLFFLLWFATLIQLGLILWELVNLVPAFHSLFGLPDANEIKAIELSTAAYLILQLAYMGKKEITRWVKRTESVLQPDEYIRRIRRGDNAVLIWGVLYLTSVLCVALHIIEHMPAELSRTFIQVATLYTCAFVSKAAFKGRINRTTKLQAQPVSGQSIEAAANIDTGRKKELFEFIKSNGEISMSECTERLNIPKTTSYRILTSLLADGLIRRQGRGRNASYTMNNKNG